MLDVAIGLLTLTLIFWVSVWQVVKLSDHLWGRTSHLLFRVKEEIEMAIFATKFERNQISAHQSQHHQDDHHPGPGEEARTPGGSQEPDPTAEDR
jgi:hypothetical protein